MLRQLGPLLPDVARKALWAKLHREPAPEIRRGPPAPVFVTLRSEDRSLRGCVGSTKAATATLTEETARSAVLAAYSDPRFPALTAVELPALSIEVSVLMPGEQVTTLAQLSPDRYGIIVRECTGPRQGLLLPGIDGIEDAETQLAIARDKAGLDVNAPVTLSRFEVLKFAG